MNGNCEFMQAKSYYRIEEQCRSVLDKQKQHMLNLAKKSDQSKIDIIEGTCVEADVKTVKGQEV